MAALLDPSMIDKERLQQLEKKAFDTIVQCLQFYKVNEITVAFNGGKDSMVLMDLLMRFLSESGALKDVKIPVFYIQPEDTFTEVDDFVDKMVTMYNIKMIKRHGNLKTVFAEFCKEMPELKVSFIGCRRTDPHSNELAVMQRTDKGWSEFMRVHPLLDWTCQDIWSYITVHKLPYCTLYDQGYTSLGSKSDTVPNPHLKVIDPVTLEVSYRPAYTLLDDKLERAGRVKR